MTFTLFYHASTKDKLAMTKDKHAINKDKHAMTKDKLAMTKDKHAITKDKHAITKDKHDIIKDKHTFTKGKHITKDRHALLTRTFWKLVGLVTSYTKRRAEKQLSSIISMVRQLP